MQSLWDRQSYSYSITCAAHTLVRFYTSVKALLKRKTPQTYVRKPDGKTSSSNIPKIYYYSKCMKKHLYVIITMSNRGTIWAISEFSNILIINMMFLLLLSFVNDMLPCRKPLFYFLSNKFLLLKTKICYYLILSNIKDYSDEGRWRNLK